MSILKLDLDDAVKATRDLFAGVTLPPDFLPQLALVLLAGAFLVIAVAVLVYVYRRDDRKKDNTQVLFLVRDDQPDTTYQAVPAAQVAARGWRRPVAGGLPCQPVRRAARAKL